MKKTYLVQSWNTDGGIANNYEVAIESDSELRELRKFLRTKFAHVLITRQPDKPKPAAKRR